LYATKVATTVAAPWEKPTRETLEYNLLSEGELGSAAFSVSISAKMEAVTVAILFDPVCTATISLPRASVTPDPLATVSNQR